MKSRCSWALVLALVWGLPASVVQAASPTAFALVKEGNKYVAPEGKNRITQIFSEKSDKSLVPNVWYIDYLDPKASFRTTEIKFVDGKMASIKEPKRWYDALNGSRQLDWKKLKVDSNGALSIAQKEPMLKNQGVRAVQFTLARTPTGSMWKIHFWTAKVGNPSETVDAGELEISTKNGAILNNGLHTEHVN
jgi:hypothetical protein